MGAEVPRLLLLLPQLPQDPGSGAARSMTSICELLVESGWRVRSLSTTAMEASGRADPAALLAARGIDVSRRVKRGAEWHFHDRGIDFRAVVVGTGLTHRGWERVHGRAFDLALSEELSAFRPDVVFTFGMYPNDLRRQRLARRAGARIVFGLRNEAYLGFRGWGHVSAVLTPSRYLSNLYRTDAGLDSTPLPVPLDAAEVVAPAREPIFMTFVNPSIHKGVDFFVQVADRLSVQRPDLPFLIVESEGRAGTLLAAGQRAGVDLRRHENIMISAGVPRPRDIFAATRVLLVPSIREAGARVVAEALMNGVPPLVSDRGGLPEMCGGAGRVLPVATDGDVALWMDALVALMDDEGLFAAQSQKARGAGARYAREALRPQYDAVFRQVLGAGQVEWASIDDAADTADVQGRASADDAARQAHTAAHLARPE